MTITTISIAEKVILELSKEYRNRARNPKIWREMAESDLWKELVSCILGSHVSREHANSALQQLSRKGLLEITAFTGNQGGMERVINEELSKPIYSPARRDGSGRRYRFPKIKARQICRTAVLVYSDGASLKDILKKTDVDHEARTALANLLPGIGLKQASLFLRNIGFSDRLAIIDAQVLKFMKKKGFIKENTRPPQTFRDYNILEGRFIKYAKDVGENPGDLDIAVWTVMRVAEVR